MNLKKFKMSDPAWQIQDGGHQNDHFISNMNFTCKISCVPKTYIHKIPVAEGCKKPGLNRVNKSDALALVFFYSKVYLLILVKCDFCDL